MGENPRATAKLVLDFLKYAEPCYTGVARAHPFRSA